MARSKKSEKQPSGEKAPTQDQLIAQALVQDIVDWKIPPGTWIRERAVAERFGVSHAPVREAFRQLTNIGLVEVTPWRGARIIEVDRHKTIEVLELWKAMFGVVCRLACDAMTASDGQELMRRLEDYKAIVRKTGNTFEHLDVSNRIGSFIAWRCGGALAREMLDRIALLARWQHHIISDKFGEHLPPEPALRSAEIYEELCNNIVDRDGDKADASARELIGHLQAHFGDALEDYLAKSEADKLTLRSTRGQKKSGA